jgi:tetratricopeptide (TPR) repeat protein
VPRAPRRRSYVAVSVVAAVLAATALVGLGRFRGAREEAKRVETIDAEPPAPRHGRPPANPIAAGAYEAAIQAAADGQSLGARRNLKKAVEADPSLAAANLRLALLAFTQDDPEDAHAAYQAALEHRAALGEVDAAVLDALEPKIRVPPVASEYVERIAKVAAAYPKDPWPSFLEGDALGEAGRLEDAAQAYERALVADPKYVPALYGKAALAGFRGDYDGALLPLEACVKATPANLECVAARTRIFGDLGRCEDAVTEAKRGLAVDPTAVELYDALASASLQTGASVATVAAFLARGVEGTLPEYRARNKAVDDENVLELSGDLRGAEASTHVWEKVLSDGKTPTEEATMRRFRVATELGELPVHRAEVLAAWDRAPAWLEPSAAELMHLAHREYEVGILTRAELDQRREAWRKARADADARLGRRTSAYTLWKIVYAIDASTDAEAREAVTLMPDNGVIPASDKADPEDQLLVGRVRARAGDYEGAIPLLTYATRACSIAIRDWLEQTSAFYYLGLSLEHTGDAEGARRAYGTVVARLGHAKPRSITADLARKRLAAMKP